MTIDLFAVVISGSAIVPKLRLVIHYESGGSEIERIIIAIFKEKSGGLFDIGDVDKL